MHQDLGEVRFVRCEFALDDLDLDGGVGEVLVGLVELQLRLSELCLCVSDRIL